MAGAAANEAGQQAAPPASDPANARPQVDPQLLMAARLGNSERLKALLGLNKDKVEAAASEAVVVVDVVPLQRTPAAEAAAAAAAAGAVDVGPATSSLPAATPLDGVTTDGGSLLHVVAACGDNHEFRGCARLIYDYDRDGKRLLDARNGNGDTPLHSAAGAGNADMISFLIKLAADSVDGNTPEKMAEKAEKKVAYLRVHNKCGETALHHAVRAAAAAAGKKDDKIKKQLMALDCINRLMAADPQLAAIPLPNIPKAASPLYLAISLGEIGIAQHLLDKSDGNLSCSGPNGRNVLHAAVSHDQDDNKDQALQALPMVLEWLENKKLKTAGVDMQQLTSQRDNDNGSTPLHLAASMAGLPSLGSKSAGPSATSLLLEANESSAYQPDNQGRYPIHAAASAGSLQAVKTLLEKCSDCATLRDARGRTFLHAAVEKKSTFGSGSPCLQVDRVVIDPESAGRQR